MILRHKLRLFISYLVTVSIIQIFYLISHVGRDSQYWSEDQGGIDIDGSNGRSFNFAGQVPSIQNTSVIDMDFDINTYHYKYKYNKNESKVKIVAFTDLVYAPVAKWWYQRMTNLSYTTHTLVLIDESAVQHFTKINQLNVDRKENDTETNTTTTTTTTTNTNTEDNIYRFETQIVDDGKRRKNKVRSLWYNRILYCLNQLKSGQSLLLTDVDNIFSRYEPLAPFYNSPYDAIFALEGRFPTYVFDEMGFVLCGGMTFLKATDATVKVMEKLLRFCDQPSHPKRCDDQVELNMMLVKDMEWNSTWAREESRLVNGLVQFGFDGVNRVIPEFRARVWDRDFAWRGEFSADITCPSMSNWVAMPHTLPDWVKKDLKEFQSSSRILSDIGVEKLARVNIWESFCGMNGTHRVHVKIEKDLKDLDTMKEALQIYKAGLRS